MRFKHTIHVLIDNFRTTYKLLLYMLVVIIISIGVCSAIVIPFLHGLGGSDANYYDNFADALSSLFSAIGNGEMDKIQGSIAAVRESFKAITDYIANNPASPAPCVVGLVAVALVRRFFVGLGNYAAASTINDRMSMHANSPFLRSLIKNLGRASAVNGIYAPLSLIYDVITIGLCGYLTLGLLYARGGVPLLLSLMLCVVAVILCMAVKMMFTTDWLPAMICGKQRTFPAMKYTIARRGKKSGAVYSFYATSLVLILGINVLAAIGTIGAGLLITVPLSYMYVLCYEFVNYCDSKEMKYFVDKRTIIKPEHEKALTREQFLRGDD